MREKHQKQMPLIASEPDHPQQRGSEDIIAIIDNTLLPFIDMFFKNFNMGEIIKRTAGHVVERRSDSPRNSDALMGVAAM